MDTYRAANTDHRRNLLDVVADLGFLERKQQALASDAAPPSPPTNVPTVRSAEPVTTPAFEGLQALAEAKQRAAEQRVAAELALREAEALEQKLNEEIEQARAASVAAAQARVRELTTSLEQAVAAERAAAEAIEALAKRAERFAVEKQRADALKIDDEAAVASASADVAAAETRLAEERRRLELARAACTESGQRFTDACRAEEAARAEAAVAEKGAAEQRTQREAIAAELRAVQVQAGVPADVESIAEAAARAAERRAADAARRLADRRTADTLRASAAS